MPVEAKDLGFKQINRMYTCWKACIIKPKRLIALDRFVPVFGQKLSLLNIHELTVAGRYNLDSFPSSLDLEQSSISLRIIKKDWVLNGFW